MATDVGRRPARRRSGAGRQRPCAARRLRAAPAGAPARPAPQRRSGTGCGPISISTEHPSAATVRALSANWTGWRECRRQYCRVERGLSREHGAGAVADQRQRRGGELHTALRRTRTRRAPDPAVPEWKAWLVCSQVQRIRLVTPTCRRSCSRSLSRTRQHCVGPVVGADRHPGKLAGDLLDMLGVGEDTPPFVRLRAGCRTAGRARPSSRAPSSRLNTPATHAAAYWPTLCPSTTSGSMPHDCHSRARPISTAKIAGWAKRGVPQRLSGLAAGLAIGGEHDLEQRARQDVLDRVCAAFHGFRRKPVRSRTARGPFPGTDCLVP